MSEHLLGRGHVEEGRRAKRAQLEALGIELELIRLGGHEFNQIAFKDPDEQWVRVVEARTFSPHPEPPASALPRRAEAARRGGLQAR